MAFLGKLSAAQARVYDYTMGAVARGLGLNAIQRSLQDIGLGIRREGLSQLVNYFNGITQAGYSVAQVRRDYFPNPDKFPEALTTLRREYSFTVRIGRTGELDEFGKPLHNYVTVTSDKNMTRRAIEDEAARYYDEASENYPVEELELEITGAKKRGAFQIPGM